MQTDKKISKKQMQQMLEGIQEIQKLWIGELLISLDGVTEDRIRLVDLLALEATVARKVIFGSQGDEAVRKNILESLELNGWEMCTDTKGNIEGFERKPKAKPKLRPIK